MAKKSSKGAAKGLAKTAAKSAAKKKSAKTAAAKPPAKAKTKAKVGEVMPKAPFRTKYKDSDLADEAARLYKDGDKVVAHLAFVLNEIFSRNLYKDEGYESFPEYCEKVLSISGRTSRQHVANWTFMDSIGLDAGDLGKFSFRKLAQLSRLQGVLKVGQIKRSFLPLCEMNGAKEHTREEIEEKVKKAINTTAEAGGSKTTSNYSFPVKDSEKGVLQDSVDEAKIHTKADTGQTVAQALAHFNLEHLTEDAGALADAQVTRKTLKMLEKANPGSRIIVLGSGPLAFECYLGKDSDGNLVACLAPDEKHAKTHMGVKKVTRVDTTVVSAAKESRKAREAAAKGADDSGGKDDSKRVVASDTTGPKLTKKRVKELEPYEDFQKLSGSDLTAETKKYIAALREAGVIGAKYGNEVQTFIKEARDVTGTELRQLVLSFFYELSEENKVEVA